jgi:hypothetical protein
MRFLPIPFLLAAFAGTSPAATFTVSQDGRGAFSSIQAAVDKASAGDEVIILDAATYEEQVTLRSLRHFSLRSANPASAHKPVIRWSDKTDVHPKTCQEALDQAKIDFDQNGALRLLYVRDVRIEGIAIDGGGPTPYNNPNVWGNGVDCTGTLYPVFFGNAAMAVYSSSQVVAIACEFRNAYFGITFKDRDLQAPFGGRGSTYATLPFGRMALGNHFFEGNSIHDNSWGVFMESGWGLGSTFRDNLIYENHHATPEAAAAVKAMSSEGANQPGGAFFFKDVQRSSMTLLNNTFWHNFVTFAGGYRPGAQHLIVNNILAEPNIAWSRDAAFPNSFLALDPYFPKRMKSNAYASQADIPILDSLYATANVLDTVTQQPVTAGKSVYFTKTALRIMNILPFLRPDTASLPLDLPLSTGIKQVRVSLPSATYMGSTIAGGSAPSDFSAADQNRWVETRFRSTQASDSGFLRPIPPFQEFLTSAWDPLRYPETSGVPSMLGALPPAARPAALLRIVPLSPVLFEGGQMVLRFSVQSLQGGPASAAPVVSYLRLEKNVPALLNGFGGTSALAVAEADSLPLPASPLHYGYNELKLPRPGLSSDSNAYGFVEMAVQGMGTLSNVAQFPIVPLSFLFTVEALDATQDIPATAITIGKTFRIRVAYAKTPTVVYPVHFSLASGAHLKFISPADADSTGAIAAPVPFTAQAQFTEVPADGVDLIWAAAYVDTAQAVTGFGQSSALVFEGTTALRAKGKERAAINAVDLLKGRNVMGRKIQPGRFR